jgi:sugar phosphate isomerase/epimerase
MSSYTRREFAKLALAAIPAAGALSSLSSVRAASAGATPKPNSRVAGVHIGLNVPYSFGEPTLSGQEILNRCVQLGLSAVELRTQSVEVFLGAPASLVYPARGKAKAAAGGAPGGPGELRKWRETVSVDRAGEYRRMYNDAGVAIEIVKVDGIFAMTEAELDYVFPLAKTLGARAISTEISRTGNEDQDHARVGKFAEKHGLMLGLHGHTKTGPADWERAFALGKNIGANLDIGHFVAGLGISPVPFLKEHHDRITHVHVKDRKKHNGTTDGPNTPFGQGDTPIVEVLQLIRDNHWPIQATIEFEYPVPAGSDRMTEIGKCVKYCRDALG